MLVSVTTGDNVFSFEVDPDEMIENVKALIEVETHIPHSQQALLFNNRELANNSTLRGCGVSPGEMLVVRRKQQQQVQQTRQTSTGTVLPNIDFSQVPILPPQQMVQPNQQQQRLNALSQMLASQFPQFTPQMLQNYLMANPQLAQQLLQSVSSPALTEEQMMSSDYQKSIEEEIKKKNIEENFGNAVEFAPESFGRVVMLYIDCEVNGHPIKAFVDSGAQATIISEELAIKIGLDRLIDERFSGLVRGVGESRSLGRIHLTQMKIGNTFFPVSITVLRGSPGMDFLLGLDMLKRHQCILDLAQGVLKIGPETVSFLAEKDLPVHLREEHDLRSPQTPTQVPQFPTGTTSTSSNPLTHTPTTNTTSQTVIPPQTQAQTQTQTQSLPLQQQTPAPANEEKIKQLCALGFTRDEATRALQAAGGNVDVAASLLFGGL